MSEHPYSRFEDTAAWTALSRAIDELSLNDDIHERTSREYIVGYILQRLDEAGVALFDQDPRLGTGEERPQ
ncbi:MAG TPA: hypothetical protein VEZ14_09715 [Dehalococcoidia bacterium]|nr:hypothetical protein [Dehalococcoidia bacterium]